MPNLARFEDRGATGRLDTLLPTYSPNIWTTIVTGKLPGEHGITAFTRRQTDGREVPFTSNSRTAVPLWQILSEAGRRVAVVGWWTTWPAEPVNGVMISDRMLYNRFNLQFGYAGHGSDLPAQTHPPELFDELAELTRIPPDFERTFLERFGPVDGEFERELHDPWYELLLVHARDDAYRQMLERVLVTGPYEFLAFYLNGPDIASHYFWKYRFPEEWDEPLPEAEFAARREVIERYYRWVDGALGPLVEQADERTVVIVVSDHGFRTSRRSDSPNISGDHYNTAPPGVILVAGGGVRRGLALERAHVADLTPTILHLLRLPVARDMSGIVIPELVRGEIDGVATYEEPEPRKESAPIRTDHDEAIVEKLRALGYL
jgi:predicted AlkP superfamily pyrophosphatase or phosphodiesterase